MNTELTPPQQKAKELFYSMYQKTKVATKKDVIYCLRIAIEEIKKIDTDNNEYWDQVNNSLDLIWI